MTPWAPPQRFDEYRLVREVGRGAMGTVWLAVDENLERSVAIKFISDAEPDAQSRGRFLQEARAIARLHHPNVVGVFRVGEVDGRPYLVTELLRGTPLSKMALPVELDLGGRLAVGLARGLAAAHRRGVLHRDVKPANAIQTEEGEVKLLDFGLAKLAGVVDAEAGSILGTPAYLAPELWDRQAATPRSDVYALGATLYHLFAGHPPHRAPSLGALAQRVAAEDAPPLRAARPEVAVGLAAAVDRALRRRPEERHADADELRAELERAARAGDRGAIPEGNPYRGLSPFDALHRGLFFGREMEVADLVDKLRGQAWVVVAGRSGVGKSSLVRAGVIPHIVDGALQGGAQGPTAWQVASLVPGTRPLRALVTACAPLCGLDEGELLRRAADDPPALARLLRADRWRGVIVAIDQLEELVTMSDAAEREAFAEVLRHAVTLSPNLRVVSTVRSDFIGHFGALGDLHRELGRSLHVLAPMTLEGIRDAVTRPAELFGFTFESRPDVESLAASIESDPASLPLLSFALAKLWERRDEARRVIPKGALPAIGGVEGALARHAEDAFALLSPAQQAEARRVLLALVTAEGTRARRTLEELAPGPDTAEVIEALLRGRLIATDEGGSYSVTHEALLAGWGRLRGWLEDARGTRRVRARLSAAADDWQRLGRPRESLWRGKQIVDIAALEGERLPPVEAAFAAVSLGAERRDRWRRRAMLVAVPTLIFGAVIGAQAYARWQARRSAAAEVAAAGALVERGHARLAEGRAERARAIAAYDAGQLDEGLARWRASEAARGDGERVYEQALEPVSRALALVAGYAPGRRLAADLNADLFEAAEERFDRAAMERALAQLRLYDLEGRWLAALAGPRRVTIATDPPGQEIAIEAVRDHARGPVAGFAPGPVTPELEPGFYVITTRGPGRAATVYSWALRPRGATELVVPLRAAVPDGYRYVPGGEMVFGTANNELIESASGVPAHWRRVAPFLVGATEVTLRQYLEYLRSLPAAERAALLGLHVRFVAEDKGGWRYENRLAGSEGGPGIGEPLELGPRQRLRPISVDWLDLPAAGVNAAEAAAHARAVGARLCSEPEWELAARGADGRIFPHGDRIAPQDASWGLTDGAERTRVRMFDPVGRYPATRSLFGVDDLVGNVAEWTSTRTADGLWIAKSGGWVAVGQELRADFRRPTGGAFYSLFLGYRFCAS